MSDTSGWAMVRQANGRALQALVSGGFCWACWQGFEAGSVLLGLFAVIFACGCSFRGLQALGLTLRILFGAFTWRCFQRGATAPMADPMAGDADLRARGILK